MSTVNKNIAVEAKLISPPTYGHKEKKKWATFTYVGKEV
jgi:hypothetical protein